jgi:hypothetical protein
VKLPAKDALSSLAVAYLDKTEGEKERADEEVRHLYNVLLV